MIPVQLTCPLGCTCEEVKDGAIYRCAWFVTLKGSNPQTGQEVDERACAIAWMPILQVEVAGTNRGQTAAIESLRNEHVLRQNAGLAILSSFDGTKKLTTD